MITINNNLLKSLLIFSASFFYLSEISAQVNYAGFVDPKIGTGGHGHTYPGASAPFGMVQLSPDTRLTGWDGCSGYHYSDNKIYGFSHTHLSGTGCSDYGDILIMPVSKSVSVSSYAYAQNFRHEDEFAEAGYYRVSFQKSKITAELTATQRVGMHRYSYPFDGDEKGFILDLKHRDEVLDSYVEQVDEHTLKGYRFSKAWAKDQRVYFVIKTKQAIKSCKIYSNDALKAGSKRESGKNIKALIQFDLTPGDTLIMKVALSGVDEDGAMRNMNAEIEGWDFDAIRNKVNNDWNTELSKIEVEGGNRDQIRTFYTALYHCFLSPNVYNDVDGRYRGRDMQVHNTGGFDYYTVFSLWDTYRGEHPLFTLFQQKRTGDFINTFIRQYEEGGALPVWELSSNETYCMIGYHAVPVIADAFLKGIKGYDEGKAYAAMLGSASQDRAGLSCYKSCGHVISNAEHESVSKTLEYAYDDWCIAQMAKKLGNDADYKKFIQRGQYYKNIFDWNTGFMRAKANGGWFSPFQPSQVDNNYTEANSWQYTFYVPQDIAHMMEYLGGKKKFEEKLDSLFHTSSKMSGRVQSDITGLIGQYAHGNEPSHHMSYLYNYAGTPWKTQAMIHKICSEMYSDKPDGLSGNEDCGQMSAWYVLSAIGFYPVCPGNNDYAIGTPMFPRVKLHFENGNILNINANNVENNHCYIQSVKVNGISYANSFFTHDNLMKGGLIEFNMGAEKSTWASGVEYSNVTSINDNNIVPVPVIESASGGPLSGSQPARLTCLMPGVKIYYTLDGTEPTESSLLYTKPIDVDRNMQIKAIAVKEGLGKSFVVSSQFNKVPEGLKVKLISHYSPQYSAGGPEALIDGVRGASNWRVGNWQGYQAQDFEAILDLGSIRKINKVGAGFLQDAQAWIWFPKELSFEISADGKNYSKLGMVKSPLGEKEMQVQTKDMEVSTSAECRYIKVKALNFGKVPAWHEGAGGDAWIFIDEIYVK